MNNAHFKSRLLILFFFDVAINACNNSNQATDKTNDTASAKQDTAAQKPKPISQPLISDIYTADPSAHVFDGKVYIYPSHDIDAGIPENDKGDHFAMRDYHILSMDSINGKVTDHGVALDIKDIPWAGRQLWAPDAAFSNGKYYLKHNH